MAVNTKKTEEKIIYEMTNMERLAIACQAAQGAILESHALGLATVQVEFSSGQVYDFYPNGRKVYKSKMQKREQK